MESPLIANGVEIARIDGFVKIEKNRTKSTDASVKYQYFCRAVSNEASARDRPRWRLLASSMLIPSPLTPN
jgi:hypothetical protein